jgi:hypothetical protein
MPLVKLYVANSYYYNCGLLVTNTIELPADEHEIREKLKEIQDEDGNGYVVLRGEAQFTCSIPRNLDILEINRKLKILTDKDKEDLKLISKLGSFSIMSIINQVLNKNYKIYENVTSEEDLGRKLYHEDQLPFKIPFYLENYIDFRKLGHEACVNNSIRIIPEMKLAEKLLNAS